MLVAITCICLSIEVMGGSALVPSLWTLSITGINSCTTLFALRTTMALPSRSHKRRQLIMPKISGHGHVLILTDGAYVDRRMDLLKRETVKECTGSGSVRKPPMLKLNYCNLSSNASDKNIEVRKR